DKSFDYVIASHILEHVDDPVAVAAELMRVAHAGYIETPSELGERLFGWSFHKWMVHREDDTLVMRPRTEESAFGDYFHRAYASDRLFAEFVDTHYDDFYVRHEWKETIHIRIERPADAQVRFNRTGAAVETLPPPKVTLLRTLRSALNLPLLLARHLRKFER
ncbi:MAG TPA: methyltransferase domain-containing protein, partial [Bacteroidota bacterium]